jgi:hypothetical protein
MTMQKKSLIRENAKGASGIGTRKPDAERPAKAASGKKLAVAKLATAKLTTAKMMVLRKLS